MKKLTYILILACIALASCSSSKSNRAVISSKTKNPSKTQQKANTKKIDRIVNYAKMFNGTKYKTGGTTKKGMDCSGLVYTSFKKEDVILPRTSRAISTQGKPISLKKIAIGDLLFFKTNKKKNAINHVGLVVKIANEIKFIHASVSKGVVISSLKEKYWNACYAGARRVL